MENMHIAATVSTPEVSLDFSAHAFSLRGESHPEDVAAFYQPYLDALERYFAKGESDTVTFTFAFIYFNSSTAKIVMILMDMLDEAAQGGRKIFVRWEHDSDDENMEELGDEFGEDLEYAVFERVAIDIA